MLNKLKEWLEEHTRTASSVHSEKEISWYSHSELETDALGALLSEVLPSGSVVALCGTLGAGKTRLVQAVARACGVPDGSVTSPTFVLIQEYHEGVRPIFHFDAYRLKDEDEFQELGPEEYFESSGVTFVEWADRVKGSLPPRCLKILIEQTGPEQRRFTFSFYG